ncbi:hypothetical protein LMG10661_00775 [Ralstonia syzygii subsp. syzygii]|nr:hypothetical protein LMG10661_00775 [Ralstonia syzygii subsp. syzygii]
MALQPSNTLARTASWIIREKASKGVLFETFDNLVVERLNTSKYEAVPVLQYLQEFNAGGWQHEHRLRAIPQRQCPAHDAP